MSVELVTGCVDLVTGCVDLVTGCVELVTGCVVGDRGAAEITSYPLIEIQYYMY